MSSIVVQRAILTVVFSLIGAGCTGNILEIRTAYECLTSTDLKRSEYGWFCEYGTVGISPKGRQAILTLIKHNAIDHIREVLRGPNPEGRLYAADALLFLATEGIELREADSMIIAEMRVSEQMINTCGNNGSYRIYPVVLRELLTDSAIAKIPARYQSFREFGSLP